MRIRGFVFSNQNNGVAFVAGGALLLEDCTFVSPGDNFGIAFRPTGASELYVSNSAISGSGSASAGGGILIKPSGSGSAKAVIDSVVVENNFTGITIDARDTTGANTVVIRNSRVAGSSAFGIYVLESGSGTTSVTIEGSTASGNGQFAVGSNGVNSIVRLRNSAVTGNAKGLAVAANSKIISLGGNSVTGNTIDGAFTSTVAQQ